ncbi:gfo/Idh/MocA family oxidoreductase [Opitutus sp. ER46]|nr:gfo/Idh/MocA family oxidoreductase [Opitutus sp. ER46]
MGGFAGSHHQAIARLEERGLAKLICTCDPNPAAFAAEQQNWRFAARGVEVYNDYRAMLHACQHRLDEVVIPTPIQLHAEMHLAAVAYGLPAYVEKPPTLDHAEFERMVAADARARKSSLVGFNFIIEQSRLALKTRLLAGEFGAIRGATLCALWPRPAGYFARNAWAGRLMLGDRLVLDSCFGNGMAAFVHNLLFWTGTGDLYSWAQIAAVRAELYRGHAIEGADTFFVEADTVDGITLRFATSHACSGPSGQTELIVCDKATLRYSVGGQVEIRWNDGRTERMQPEPFDPLTENHLAYFRYLNGESPRPATKLADARPFVTLNALAYLSSGRITPLPADQLSWKRDEKEQKDYLQISGMAAVQENFLVRGVWPSAAGWARSPAEVATPADLPRLPATIREMVSAVAK